MRERLLLSGFFLILAVLFLPTNAGASACVTLEKPVSVSKGGVLWNDASNILTEDSVALIMGTQGKSRGDDKHASPTGGWVGRFCPFFAMALMPTSVHAGDLWVRQDGCEWREITAF